MPTVDDYISKIDGFIQQGNMQDALTSTENGLAENPKNALLMTAFGRVKWAIGDIEGAAQAFQDTIEEHPENAFALMTFAGFLLNNHFASDAYTLAERAHKIEPNWMGPKFVLARAAMTINRADLAIETMADVKPENISNHLDLMNAGILIHALGDQARADTFFNKARPMFPSPEAYTHSLSLFANNAQNYPLAVAALGEMLQKVGDRQELRDQLAYGLSVMGLPKAAAKSFQRVAEANPDHPETSLKYAHFLLLGDGHVDEITKYASIALAHNRDNPQAIEILARMKAFTGETEEASDLLNRAIHLLPDNFNLYGLLGTLIPLDKDHAAFKRLEAGKAEVEHNEVLGLINKTLGKLYLSVDETDKAFAAFAEGNEHTKKAADDIGLAYVPDMLDQRVDEASGLFRAEFREQVGDVSDKSTMPLYVVGMPGTGGAILANLLARHSQIANAGERFESAQASHELDQVRVNKKDKMVARHIREHAPRWRRRILDVLGHTKNESEKDPQYVIDCYSGNFNHLGLISTLFPKAKYIHITRDPMDLAFAIYSGTFQLTHNYTTSFDNIVHYMKAAERQMAVAREALGDNLLEISYEGLMQDTKVSLEKVIEFLGLNWEDAISAYEDPADADKTMNVVQTRSQLDHHGIGEGKKHKAHLADLIKALGA